MLVIYAVLVSYMSNQKREFIASCWLHKTITCVPHAFITRQMLTASRGKPDHN